MLERRFSVSKACTSFAQDLQLGLYDEVISGFRRQHAEVVSVLPSLKDIKKGVRGGNARLILSDQESQRRKVIDIKDLGNGVLELDYRLDLSQLKP
jgi:hypothetical protein